MHTITISTTINRPIHTVWECWHGLEHIPHWCFASNEWGAEGVSNDVRVGGSFTTKMFARDGSAAFDFSGKYTAVVVPESFSYQMDDGRTVDVIFEDTESGVVVTESFDAETEHSLTEQQQGWQAILDNFKAYVERQS